VLKGERNLLSGKNSKKGDLAVLRLSELIELVDIE